MRNISVAVSPRSVLPYLPAPASELCDHHFYFSPEGLPPDGCAEEDRLLSVDVGPLPDENVLTRMYVYGPVKFLWASASWLPETGIEILQHRAIPQSAYDTESEFFRSRDKIIACKQAVTHENVGDGKEPFPVVEYGSEALCGLLVALVLHMFQIEWSAFSRREGKCLYREEEPCVAHPSGNLCRAQDLDAPLYHTGTPRPIAANTWGLTARLAQEAVVKCNGCPVARPFEEHVAVEGAPVEFLLEILPEATLTGVSMPGHRQEIHSSVYRQYQNHCLDEETFKIFSYLRGPIERRCDNRPYLVKWLNFIHNLLISSFKVIQNLALDQIFQALILLKINKVNMFYNILF